jgi:alpha-mannosidase
LGQARFLRILAPDIPAVGYKVFEMREGVAREFPRGRRAIGNVVENKFYRVVVSERGAITSLVDKTLRQREVARNIHNSFVNDFGPGSGAVSIENAGPVSVTVKATAEKPLAHTARVTLIRDSRRIGIRNEITEGFDDIHVWRFSFDLAVPDVWHEECGTVLRAKPVTAGGHYATWAARVDWLTLNHFADMGSGDGLGVTLSNADWSFMKLGKSSYASLDTQTPQVSVLAGGGVGGDRGSGIPNQGGHRHFLQRFALQTRKGCSPAAAMRFALKHQNPLVAGAVTGTDGSYPERSFSLLTISSPHVLLWTLKPAEEGFAHAVIARLWNLADSPSRFTLRLARGLSAARQTTHIETDLAEEDVSQGALPSTLRGNQMQTYRLFPGRCR